MVDKKEDVVKIVAIYNEKRHEEKEPGNTAGIKVILGS